MKRPADRVEPSRGREGFELQAVDEYDVGFYMKRARASELTFGDAAFHRRRWATLAGY